MEDVADWAVVKYRNIFILFYIIYYLYYPEPNIKYIILYYLWIFCTNSNP